MKRPSVAEAPISTELYGSVDQADALRVGALLLPCPAAKETMPQLGGGNGVDRCAVGTSGANNQHGKYTSEEDLRS